MVARRVLSPVLSFASFIRKYLEIKPADGEGFEPSVPFWSTHAFQACPIDHSGTRPSSSEPDTMSGGREKFKRRCSQALWSAPGVSKGASGMSNGTFRHEPSGTG